MCKVFSESNNGEAILIWLNRKRLFIQVIYQITFKVLNYIFI